MAIFPRIGFDPSLWILAFANLDCVFIVMFGREASDMAKYKGALKVEHTRFEGDWLQQFLLKEVHYCW